jgi:hypothetical protein
MARRLIHEKRFKRFCFADGFFHGPALVVEFAAKARPAAVLLACKLAFHAPLISNEKALATLNIQVNAPIAVVEMGAPVQDAVSQRSSAMASASGARNGSIMSRASDARLSAGS